MPRSKFIDELYYIQNMTLVAFFVNRLTFYSKSVTPFCMDITQLKFT